MKLTQHGSFDESFESAMREELLAEFAEAEALDFAACQRADGSVYPIAAGKQCKKGTPISYRPGDRQGDVYNKGRAAGMRVESILEENRKLREEKGLRMVKGPEAVQSLVRRLNQRMGIAQKPQDVKGVKSVADAAKVIQAKGADPDAVRRNKIKEDKRIARMRAANERADARAKARKEAKAKAAETPSKQASQAMRDLVKAGDRLDARAAQSAADRLQAAKKAQAADALIKPRPPAQEGVLKMGVAIARKDGDPAKIKAAQDALREFRKQQRLAKEAARPGAKAAKPAAEKPSMQINKRFLRQEPTQKLEQYLRDRKLYAYQRKAIEAELAKRAKGGKGIGPETVAANNRKRQEMLAANIKRQEAAAKPDIRGAVKARKAAIDEIDRQIAQIRKRRQEPAYQKPEHKAFLDSVEKGLMGKRRDIIDGKAPVSAKGPGTKELIRKAGELKKTPSVIEARRKLGRQIKERLAIGRPPSADSNAGTIASAKPKQVNQKFLRQPDRVLQAALRRGDLNPAQRRKIEEELGGRGVTPAKAVKIPTRDLDAVRKAGWRVDEGVKGYDPLAVYNRPDNQLLAKGAFGAAYRTDGPPPGIIKQGKIGEHEADVWRKLQGTDRVPEFHGAAVSPNMRTVGAGYGGHVKEGNGYLGLGMAKGEPVGKQGFSSPKEKADLINEYIRARRDIHMAGVAHNDMHANNVFYDKATGKMQLIDFGLAQPTYKAALMEALTTNQGDWQSERFLSYYKPRGDEPAAYNRFRRNQRAVMRQLEEQGIDTGYLMAMGIRNKPEHIDRVLEGMSETAAKAYVQALYDGV